MDRIHSWPAPQRPLDDAGERIEAAQDHDRERGARTTELVSERQVDRVRRPGRVRDQGQTRHLRRPHKRLRPQTIDEVRYLAEDSPAWGPYGEIVFVRGRSNLWRMKLDGSGKRLLARNVGKVSWLTRRVTYGLHRRRPLDDEGDAPCKARGADRRRPSEVPVLDSRWLVMDSVTGATWMPYASNGIADSPAHESRPDLYNMWPAWQRVPR